MAVFLISVMAVFFIPVIAGLTGNLLDLIYAKLIFAPPCANFAVKF